MRVDKAMRLRNLPSKSWEVNREWMLACNLDHVPDCWVRLLALHDQGDFECAEPDTMRCRLYHLPACLAHHARRRRLRIEHAWSWAGTVVLAWRRLTTLPAAN